MCSSDLRKTAYVTRFTLSRLGDVYFDSLSHGASITIRDKEYVQVFSYKMAVKKISHTPEECIKSHNPLCRAKSNYLERNVEELTGEDAECLGLPGFSVMCLSRRKTPSSVEKIVSC